MENKNLNTKSRKYQLTINNPQDHGLSHEKIWEILEAYPHLCYGCMSDEVGAENTPHTHIFLVFENPIAFNSIRRSFKTAHIEKSLGSCEENKAYIMKSGKWVDTEKSETSIEGTFEERGTMPEEKGQGFRSDISCLYELIKSGYTNVEILEAEPTYAVMHIDKLDKIRQALLMEENKNEYRKLDVTYIWGKTGVGKSRYVLEKHTYSECYRIVGYKNPFDEYAGQDVIVFDEFRSSLPISLMLTLLDGYPTALPCRYQNKQACYTQVYLISNIPLKQQYENVQLYEQETYNAFLRRINRIIHMTPEIYAELVEKDRTQELDGTDNEEENKVPEGFVDITYAD